MKCLICVDLSDAERVVERAAPYLAEASEAVVVCAVDERASRGYGMMMRGLLGRRARDTELKPTALESAEETVRRAVEGLRRARPDLPAEGRTLSGRPGEEISALVREEGFDAVLLGRGNTGPEVPVELSGTVCGWRTNHHGDRDGLLLDVGEAAPVEVRFPPHRGEAVGRAFSEGEEVRVSGVRRGEHVHAYTLSGPAGEPAVEAHRPPEKESGPGRVHLGHVARFVTDHVECDVVLIS
ncbi:Universal stress protein family [Rubrobacter radiotolerans]|nr:Universal stress protein family [Rubrobacter radiotolerans]SMC04291.1 Universal stress protein family protein [Rubrobacter radiotolerans DSM 5868]